ncbi:MAG TPA: hypothetical protein VF731_06225 [Solirubrobacterales bacterium]
MRMLARGLAAASAAVFGLVIVFGTVTSVAAAEGCPNEALRAGHSRQLADCRAYEMVSPADMNGNGVEQVFAVRGDGQALAYGTLNVFGDAGSSLTGKWRAVRTSEGWATSSLNPPLLGRNPNAYDEPVALGFSADLSGALLGTRYPFDPRDASPYVNLSDPGNGDLYLLDPGPGAEWVSHGATLPDETSFDRAFGGASADLSRIFFETAEPLTAAAAGSTLPNVYEDHAGALATVNVDETGTLIPGGAGIGRGQSAVAAFYSGAEFQGGNVNQGHATDRSAVSADGRTVVFTAPLEPSTAKRQVYVRRDGATAEASLCRFGPCAGEGAPSGALFLVASPNGGTTLFFSRDRLTEAAPAGGGIYSFDVATEALSFLTPVGTGSVGFRHGGLLAASEDLSYLYLCESGSGVSVFHAGEVKPVAAVPCNADAGPAGATEPTADRAGGAVPGVEGITSQGEPRPTPDSGYVFTTTAELGGYDNAGESEAYLYEAASGALRCLSCRPDGAPARAGAFLGKGSGTFENRPTPLAAGVSVRNLNEAGNQAFFVSEEQLLPQDIDGTLDVYEWERAGTGGCGPAAAGYSAASGGCVSLVSSGTDRDGSVLEGVSASGEDVFVATASNLVPADTGTELELYDARVDGGLAAQNAAPGSPCEGESSCRPPNPPPPAAPPAASAAFSGEGNATPRHRCRKGRHAPKGHRGTGARRRAHKHRHGRCVKGSRRGAGR